MSEYRHIDTKRANGCYVTFARKLTEDRDFQSRDAEEDAGIEDGSLVVFGVQAEAHVMIVRHGVGTAYTLTSAGCWGVVVAGSTDPYLAEVYGEELEALRDDLTIMGAWTEVKA